MKREATKARRTRNGGEPAKVAKSARSRSKMRPYIVKMDPGEELHVGDPVEMDVVTGKGRKYRGRITASQDVLRGELTRTVKDRNGK